MDAQIVWVDDFDDDENVSKFFRIDFSLFI